MIERRGVRVVKLERGDGNGAVADGGHVGVRFDALDKLLLVQPEIAAAARVEAWLKDVAGDLGGLFGETHFAAPRIWHVDVQQNAGWKTFPDDQRHEREHKIRGWRKVDLLGAIGNRNGDGWHAIDGAFHGGTDGSRIINVFAHVAAAINAGDYEIGFLFK